MVLDTRSVVHGLPHSIDGFFYLSTHPDGANHMRQIRQKFMAQYRLTPETAPPLVRLSFEGPSGFIDGDAPFTYEAT